MPCFYSRFRGRRIFIYLFAFGFSIGLWLNALAARSEAGQALSYSPVEISQTASATDVGQIVTAGVNAYGTGLYVDAIAHWRTAYEIYEATQDTSALATVSENLARAYQQVGDLSQELRYWQSAIEAVRQFMNLPNTDSTKLGRLLIEQAQAYSRLGQHRRAIAILCNSSAECIEGSGLQLAEAADDTAAQVAALGGLGEAYRATGELDIAQSYLEQGLELSQTQGNLSVRAVVFNSLGDTFAERAEVGNRRAAEAAERGAREATALQAQANEDNTQAIAYFQQSYEIAKKQEDSTAEMRSLLRLVSATSRFSDAQISQTVRNNEYQSYRTLAIGLLNQLSDTQTKAFAALKLADLASPDTKDLYGPPRDQLSPMAAAEVTNLLNQALAIGESIENAQVISFAYGALGRLDAQAGRYREAISHTQKARLAAEQTSIGRESLYLWDWQIGRLWNVLNNKEAAVQAYAQAVDQLEKIRRETLSTNKTWQFDFRDAVEPIYRQYAALNIRDVPETSAISEGGSAFSALNNTLTTLDSLKVSELQSYFANDCIIAPITTRVDAVENAQATAVVSTAILGQNVSDTGESEGQLVVIASFPNGIKKVTQVVANGETVERVINQFRRTLEAGNREYITEYDQTPGRQLYQWLIAPFEPDLIDVQTLVFVNDGLLRSVPMAALYDGEQYLIEKFAIATTPSLTLTNPEPLKRPPQLSALLMGVSQPVALPARSFEALPAVDEELAQVAEILPSSQILLNQELSVASLKQTLADTDYRILHLATHGTFGFDPDENFVVLGARQTSGDFNQVLTIGELDSLIREASGPDRAPIELLTLTACETAIGDRRATLGLAGIAVRAGVKSAIATLWSVGDASSAQLISDFYTQLQDPTLTKAQALQNAQIAMIRNSDSFINQHPYRWASFILIGNWL